MSRSGSFVGKAVTNNSSFYGDTASRQKSRSYHEEEEEMVIKPQKLHGRSMESASVTKFDRNMQNSMSKYNYEYPHDRAEISVSSNGDSGQMNRSIFRAGSAGGAGSNHITETILEIESLIQQGYSREKAIRIYFDRNPDRSYDPNASYNIEENQYYPEDDFSEEQSIIEQRLIGAKKNPDQEALEHGLLLSQQEAEFGVNMYESLTPDDELVIDEYVAQDFTREEAILFIFEHKYGKVSTQPKNITPALVR